MPSRIVEIEVHRWWTTIQVPYDQTARAEHRTVADLSSLNLPESVETVKVIDPRPVEFSELEGMGWENCGVGVGYWSKDLKGCQGSTTVEPVVELYPLKDGGAMVSICDSFRMRADLLYPDLATALLAAEMVAMGQGGLR